MKNQVILFFAGLSFEHPLSGRAKALARAFAKKGFKTIFIEIPSSPIDFISRVLPQRKVFREFLFPKVKVIENIIIIPAFPILPFGRLKLIMEVNKIVVALRLREIISKVTKNEIKRAIFCSPYWFQVVRYLGGIEIYYDCIDEISVLCIPRDVGLYKKWEEKLVRISSSVFAITPLLRRHILNISHKKKVVLLPNGVDVQEFEKRANSLPVPEDIARIKKPIAGYIGGIFPWLDLELIVYCAKRLKNWSFVLVGPITNLEMKKSMESVKTIPNLYLFGEKSYEYIPCYINAFDVCLIPFKLDKIGDNADPIKLYEYLAIGKPVVSTNIAIMKELNELVYVGEDKNSFVQKIKEAYEERLANLEIRKNYAKENSWDKKINKLLSSFKTK